jgi:hypothetical protein
MDACCQKLATLLTGTQEDHRSFDYVLMGAYRLPKAHTSYAQTQVRSTIVQDIFIGDEIEDINSTRLKTGLPRIVAVMPRQTRSVRGTEVGLGMYIVQQEMLFILMS